MPTSSIPQTALERVIEDLYNDLRYLLIADGAWKVVAALDPERPDTEGLLKKLPHHLQSTALDSALLHGRALLVFFTANHDDHRLDENHNGINWRHYGAKKQESKWLNRWKDVLNGRLFHMSRMRPQVEDPEGTEQLNEQTSKLATEVLDCWDAFAKSITNTTIRNMLDVARAEAVAEGTLAETRVRQIMGR